MGMLANRLQKNIKKLAKWARKNDIECYRIYQQDIPEYPIIVDRYGAQAVVWANERKRDESEEAKRAFLDDVCSEVRSALGIAPEGLFLKQRHPGGQYRRQEERPFLLTVSEGDLRFKVNLSNYHDTGLFLDHRPTRRWLRENACGCDVLNLFCYTGSFSVYAAAAPAYSVTSVDLSDSYLDWLEDNLALNGFKREAHRLVRADVMDWLPQAHAEGRSYDIIICDPPTFSNSKRMEGMFDVVSDHMALLEGCLKLLRPAGTLLFSTNKRGFRLNERASALWDCRDVTAATTDPDFTGRVHHQAWIIKRKRASRSDG